MGVFVARARARNARLHVRGALQAGSGETQLFNCVVIRDALRQGEVAGGRVWKVFFTEIYAEIDGKLFLRSFLKSRARRRSERSVRGLCRAGGPPGASRRN